MYINGLGFGYYSKNFNSKKERNSSVTSQPSFGALVIKNGSRVVAPSGFRCPKLKNEATKQFWEKMQVRLCNFPLMAKRAEPGFFTVGEEKFRYTIEKNSNNITHLCIKNRVETPEQWNQPEPERSVIDCSFDINGLMYRADITHPVKKDYSTGIFYYNSGKEGRMLRVDDVTYKPTSGKDNVWSVIQFLSTRNVRGDVDMSVKLKDVMLSDLFLELMMKRTSAFMREKK